VPSAVVVVGAAQISNSAVILTRADLILPAQW
jgi:hypothetical protein